MSNKLGKVLIVDGDKVANEAIGLQLKSTGYMTKSIYNSAELTRSINDNDTILIILDIATLKKDGIEILKDIRKKSSIPIIIVTAKNDLFYKVLTLDLGADDYILKPYDGKELLARIRAILRRTNTSIKELKEEKILLDNLIIDIQANEVILDGKLIKLPPKEFELLYFLVKNSNKIYSREDLMNEIWEYEYTGDSRTVDVHIKRIRSKLKGNDIWSLDTVWGKGYKFKVRTKR